MAAQSTPPLPRGYHLNDYVIDKRIGGGGFSLVYLAYDMEGQAVAIKGQWIAYVGDTPGPLIGPDTAVIDAAGRTLIPGLIDGHVHITGGGGESGSAITHCYGDVSRMSEVGSE